MIRRGIGVQSFVSAGGTDADAQAFITAAGITDATQQSAINTLVTDLKGYGIWTKMKAIYPFVGGTASAHKFNLKDPRDLDAAFRLVFSGGWTHSSTGALPNGTNGYADTFLTLSAAGAFNNCHLSYYSRTNNLDSNTRVEIGRGNGTASGYQNLYLRLNNSTPNIGGSAGSRSTSVINSNSAGFGVNSSTSSTSQKIYLNGSLVSSTTATQTASAANLNIFIGSQGNLTIASEFSNRECAFASIGDGLTDTDASNLYTAVQKYQTTLGRSVGTQTVSDSDAQAFVNAAVIEDQVQATAINTLVVDLKGYGIWTKMKAIYPFVGGTSSTHKWNLKDPRDLDAAFRLVFFGGGSHSSNGYLPNGVNSYADSKLNSLNNTTLNSTHFSYYSRTNSNATEVEISSSTTITGGGTGSLLEIRTSGVSYYRVNSDLGYATYTDANSLGFYIANRTASNVINGWKNGSKVATATTASKAQPNINYWIGALNQNNVGSFYTTKECAFASIGDGLTDTEAANLYTAVQAYQTTLSRNV